MSHFSFRSLTLVCSIVALAGAPTPKAFADQPAPLPVNFPQTPLKPYRQRIAGQFAPRTVAPHWMDDGDSFWYRVDKGAGRSEFVSVDARAKTRRPAFDHRELARALSREIKAPVDADKLPFSWIRPAPDGAWTRFRAGSQVWQFNRDGSLERSQGELAEEKLAPMKTPRASRRTGDATALTFVNRTGKSVSLFWLDMDGNKKPYETIAPGATLYRTTFAGHVWQVFDGDKSLGAWEAPDNEASIVLDNSGSTGAAKPETAAKSAPQPIEKDAATKPSQPRAFVRDYNLWARGADGEERQITTDGNVDDAYQDLYFSPDGRHLVAWQNKPEQEHLVTLVDSSPSDRVQPKVKTIQYLKPGDRVRIERPRLFDLDERREIPTSDALFANPWNIGNLGWNAAGDEYLFSFNARGHQNYRILGLNNRGEVRAIVQEQSPTFIDYSNKITLRQMPKSGELIWASERDGWNHLYLYDVRAGQVKNQITRGKWLVREVERVDEAKRQIWFRGFGMVAGQDPYYAQLARINFDGSGLKILTEGDGDHNWKWSPDKRFIIDTYSRIDVAPITNLRDADGQLLVALESADLEALKQAGGNISERFAAPGRDGKTEIYGIITRPSDFDATRKYPVIEQIYAGPQSFYVPKSFSTLEGIHELADRGYIVVQIDGMGTNWRSRAFHDVAWKNLKDAGFPDRIAWMKAAQKTRPWMDLSRVGIYGGSAGGQSALGALIWHGDFYKAAAADCGCHDNRMDKIWWNEQWMGWPVDQSYADSSNVVHAARMQGHLLLTVGELDTNVDPASTTQVVDALIKAGKDFDYILFPGAGHGIGNSAYGRKRRNEFFDRWLQP